MAGGLREQLIAAGLAPSSGAEPTDPQPADAPAPAGSGSAPGASAPLHIPARVDVRFSKRAGQGRRATRIRGLAEAPEAWLKELCAALGVGGRIDGDELVLQGNQIGRVVRFFEAKGVRRIVR